MSPALTMINEIRYGEFRRAATSPAAARSVAGLPCRVVILRIAGRYPSLAEYERAKARCASGKTIAQGQMGLGGAQ